MSNSVFQTIFDPQASQREKYEARGKFIQMLKNVVMGDGAKPSLTRKQQAKFKQSSEIIIRFERSFRELTLSRAALDKLENLEHPTPVQVQARELARKEMGKLEETLDGFIWAFQTQMQNMPQIKGLSDIKTFPSKRPLFGKVMQGAHWGNLKVK